MLSRAATFSPFPLLSTVESSVPRSASRDLGAPSTSQWGFGIPLTDRSATHDAPSAIGMLHNIWQFLLPQERVTTSRVCQAWKSYIRLRITACQTSVSTLRATRPPLSKTPSKQLDAICDFPRENEELQLEQELSRQSDSKIGTT
jgi:hypothetical protein